IQRSARALGIQSEAATRFSRGTDPNGVLYALDRAAQLMESLAGGKVLQGAVDAYPRPIAPWKVPLKVDQINTLLGTALTAAEMAEILEKLELKVEGDWVAIPTFRPDLTRVADLAEEIARLYGLDNIPAARTTPVPYRLQPNRLDRFVDELKSILTGLGLQEVITNSMINARRWEVLTGRPVYAIMNPLSADMSGLRNTLLPSLLQVVQHNHYRQVRDVRIFEINRVFHPPAEASQLPEEHLHLAIALSGLRQGDSWYSNKQPIDFYDIKGLIEALADKISLDSVEFISYDNFAVERYSQAVLSGSEQLGFFGKVRPAWLEAFDLEHPVWVAELSVTALFQHRQVEKLYRPVPRFPWVDRDLAVVVRRDVEAGQLVALIRSLGIPDLREVQIFDVYEGKQIEAGKKSVALRFFFQSDKRTLTEEEVNRSMERILEALASEFQARLRT
ncbi:MAG: phenylalanine--tRNA ligase subunit beta, partial [Calditrichaeota bacterium]